MPVSTGAAPGGAWGLEELPVLGCWYSWWTCSARVLSNMNPAAMFLEGASAAVRLRLFKRLPLAVLDWEPYNSLGRHIITDMLCDVIYVKQSSHLFCKP